MALSITTKELFKRLTIIFAAQVMVVVGFAIGVFFLSGANPLDAETARLYKYVLLAIVPAGYVAGNFIYRKGLSAIGSTETLKSKITKVQASMLIRWACNEVPGLMAAFTAFSTGDITLLLFSGISIALMITLRPNKETLANDLPLTDDEKSLLDNPDAVLYQVGK